MLLYACKLQWSLFASLTVSSLFKFHRDELPESAYRHQLLGLNLLFLLSQNRVSEFHTELERLSAKDIQTNVYIRHPVSLEQVRKELIIFYSITHWLHLGRSVSYTCGFDKNCHLLLLWSVPDGGQLQQSFPCQGEHPCWKLYLLHWHSLGHHSVGIVHCAEIKL